MKRQEFIPSKPRQPELHRHFPGFLVDVYHFLAGSANSYPKSGIRQPITPKAITKPAGKDQRPPLIIQTSPILIFRDGMGKKAFAELSTRLDRKPDGISLSPGDRLEFIIEKDHTVRLVAKQIPVKNLKGMLPKPNTPVSLEEMNRAILSGSYKS